MKVEQVTPLPWLKCPVHLTTGEMIALGIDNYAGCYGVFYDDRPLYIGKSLCLLRRLRQHFIDQNDGMGVQFRLSGLTEWYMTCYCARPGSILRIWRDLNCHELELHLIKTLHPVYNTHYVNPKARAWFHQEGFYYKGFPIYNSTRSKLKPFSPEKTTPNRTPVGLAEK